MNAPPSGIEREGLGEKPLSEILLLEHPNNPEAYNKLNRVIRQALNSGELPGTHKAISPGNYSFWRARKCPENRLSESSLIHQWIGAPLNERVRCGLLSAEKELPIWEILELEFPADDYHEPSNEYLHWQKVIETALHRGLLVSRPETQITQGETCLTGDWLIWLIDRKSYRQWLTSKANPPANSDICAWLDAAPASELTTLISPARTATVAKDGEAGKKAALLALLDEVDKRAAEKNAGFDRQSIPGTKAEFHELLKAYYPDFRYIGLLTTAGYLKNVCKFQHGVQPKNGKGAAVWELFPEYALKLG